MKIVVVGSGYVGLIIGTCFAEFGFSIECLDEDHNKIKMLNNGLVPIYEPGLSELVTKNLIAKRLQFSSSKEILKAANVIIIAVGTPGLEGGGVNMMYVENVVNDIICWGEEYHTIILKSTVPAGTAEMIKQKILSNKSEVKFDIISNPEFLREGSALEDFMLPDRIIVGCSSQKAQEIAKKLYNPLIDKGVPILFTDNKTAELIKYAANSYLAMRVAYINEISDLAEKIGADVMDVAQGMGLDKRIGASYLRPGPGFGGSCFPKDTKALSELAQNNNMTCSIVDTVITANENRKHKMVQLIINSIAGNLADAFITVLGLTFKANTDDVRDSPAINIILELIKLGIKIKAYDPKGMNEAKKYFTNVGDSIKFCTNLTEASMNSECMVIMTEWKEFEASELMKVKQLLKRTLIVDLRNMLDPEEMSRLGFTYISLGRKCQNYLK